MDNVFKMALIIKQSFTLATWLFLSLAASLNCIFPICFTAMIAASPPVAHIILPIRSLLTMKQLLYCMPVNIYVVCDIIMIIS